MSTEQPKVDPLDLQSSLTNQLAMQCAITIIQAIEEVIRMRVEDIPAPILEAYVGYRDRVANATARQVNLIGLRMECLSADSVYAVEKAFKRIEDDKGGDEG